MTADPGAYDVVPEREFLGHPSRTLDPVAASWTVMRHALDRTARACGIRPGVSPSIIEHAVETSVSPRLAIADAALALRAAELNGLAVDSDVWADLMGRLRDATDRALGVGIGARP